MIHACADTDLAQVMKNNPITINWIFFHYLSQIMISCTTALLCIIFDQPKKSVISNLEVDPLSQSAEDGKRTRKILSLKIKCTPKNKVLHPSFRYLMNFSRCLHPSHEN